MSALQNPMGINGPGWAGNYVQPNTANPAPNSDVADYPNGFDTLLAEPILPYVQGGTTAPQNGATVYSYIPENPMQL